MASRINYCFINALAPMNPRLVMKGSRVIDIALVIYRQSFVSLNFRKLFILQYFPIICSRARAHTQLKVNFTNYAENARYIQQISNTRVRTHNVVSYSHTRHTGTLSFPLLKQVALLAIS
jgi:hypothetical protein